MKNIQIIGIFLMLLVIPKTVEANRVTYTFDGKALQRLELYGDVTSSTYCKNKINLKQYNIWTNGIGNIYVSSDGKYFVFAGSESAWGQTHFLVVDIPECRIVRELDPGYPSAPYISLAASAFSPDSKKLFITWSTAYSASSNFKKLPGSKLEKIGGPFGSVIGVHWTKEFSGKNFRSERILKNMPGFGRAYEQDRGGWWIYSYKFSRHGDLLLSLRYSRTPNITRTAYIYDIAHDKILANFNEKNLHMNGKKYYDVDISNYYKEGILNIEPDVPDITKKYLLYNFVTPTGSEMDIFNYNSKKIAGKIINPYKGLGEFSFDGKRVIFSEFPNPPLWKKNIIVYNTFTGAVIGGAVLDEDDEATDVSPDDTKLIFKENGTQKTIDLRPVAGS